jgi:beta-galactosidase
MGFSYIRLLVFSVIFLFSTLAYSQIKFRELPRYQLNDTEQLFFDINEKRSIISLNGEWSVYRSDDDKQKKVTIRVPSIFEGEGELIFEKSFDLNRSLIDNNQMRVNFLGLNYTADVLVNNHVIYRHSGGDFPFQLEMPKDLLHHDKPNIISVKLFYKLDSENTIPIKQRFLFPRSFGGILRDVYIHLTPNISIADINIDYSYSPGNNRVRFTAASRIENKEFAKSADTLLPANQFTVRFSLSSPEGVNRFSSPDQSFSLGRNKEKQVNQILEIANPMLWSPLTPHSYIASIEVWRGAELVDKSERSIAIYSLTTGDDSLYLNNSSFNLQGVTYIPSVDNFGSLLSYEQMENDIRLIKATGFNSVRFNKQTPHPYYLLLCERYGLFAFIELPINSIPTQLTNNQNFVARSRNYLVNFLKGYKRYSVVAGLGLGGSFILENDSHQRFLENLAGQAKSEFKKIVYASFMNYSGEKITGLDMYGVELYNTSIHSDSIAFNEFVRTIGEGRVFISAATYTVNIGSTDGYTNAHSYEAQAKFYEDLFDFSDNSSFAGFFINSMFDYQGDFPSLSSGYNHNNLYSIGIAGEDRNTSRISYKVVQSKLLNAEEVTIPIGSSNDDAPMAFIIFGIILAILVGVLINSGRKFREDSSRALLRPYNFFADVRDQRIMSGFHTTGLAVVIVAISALLVSNILFYLKENIFFERLLLSFGSPGLIKVVSFLAWNPLYSLLWLTIGFGVLLVVTSLIIKVASFFVRNRVYLISVYFTVVWSLLPLILLIPLGIILYRLLNADIANLYIYLLLFLFGLWIFYRLMKGIYVIYDVNAGSVYFYSILFLCIVFGGIILYYELNNSVINYILLTLKQYNYAG